MRLLVFQHTDGETPAAFASHAAAAGDSVEIIRAYAGDPYPDAPDHDALLVMGGPMDVWEVDANPWIPAEISAIAAWLATGKPYLGVCLGHQLLACAAGGTCTRLETPEIAVAPVTLTPASAFDPLVGTLPSVFAALHWHGVEVSTPPQGSQILGASQGCANQVMRVGDKAWGLQFHPELKPGTCTAWMQDPGNRACAIDWLGSLDTAMEFVAAAEAEVTGFLDRSARLYRAFRAQA